MTYRLLRTAAAASGALLLVACSGTGGEEARAGGGPAASASSTQPASAATTTPTPTAARLEIGSTHCFVEPVTFDGQTWNVPYERQFGQGGLRPERWQGTGVMTRVAERRARFEDDGGATVVFLPVDDPSVTPVEEALCD